ncbi:hypothetical protein H3V16_07210 [Bartonella sp. W8099]|nr:hypothetical protein [Bartonella apis]
MFSSSSILKVSSCLEALFGKSAVTNGNIGEGNLKRLIEAVLTDHADFISLLKWKDEAVIFLE